MRSLSTLLVILLGLLTVGCDQSTKQFALANLQDAPHALLPGLSLTYTENRDMAFGLLSALLDEEARLWILTFAKSVAVLIGVAFFVTRHRISSAVERTGLALVLAGAAGNLIDRVRLGYVVDFLEIPYWPIFNVADVAIVIGMGLLVVEFHRRAVAVPAAITPAQRSRDPLLPPARKM